MQTRRAAAATDPLLAVRQGFVYVLLSKAQTSMQMVGLVLLFLAAVVLRRVGGCVRAASCL